MRLPGPAKDKLLFPANPLNCCLRSVAAQILGLRLASGAFGGASAMRPMFTDKPAEIAMKYTVIILQSDGRAFYA
jgi:hypothetical protein